MKDEIKEILDRVKKNPHHDFILSNNHTQQLLDYITNLQKENERLKELCDKYEEEHSTTFNEWKETITDKYQTLKDLQEENEKLKIRNKEIYDGFIATQEELSDYATRNEKANWWLKEMLKQAKSDETKAIINGTLELLEEEE